MLADHLSFVNAFVFAEPVRKGESLAAPERSELIESILLSRTVIATLRNLHFLDFRHIVSWLFVKLLKVFLMQREGLGALESQDPTPALRHRSRIGACFFSRRTAWLPERRHKMLPRKSR